MRHFVLSTLLILPLILWASVADIVVKGSCQELRLTEEDFNRLFPLSDNNDSVNIDRFITYGMKLLAAKEEGLDTMLNLKGLPEEIKNDLLVGEWTKREIERRLNQADIEDYFFSNKEKYKWDKPRFKGRLILGENDSITAKAVEAIRISHVSSTDSIKIFLRKNFGTEVTITTILVEQGRNPYADMAVYGTSLEAVEYKWRSAKVLNGQILSYPESPDDVKDILMEDYIKTIEEKIKEYLMSYMTIEL